MVQLKDASRGELVGGETGFNSSMVQLKAIIQGVDLGAMLVSIPLWYN